METITMINPLTSETYDIPISELTDYMLQGLVPVEESESNDYILCQTCQDSYLEDDDHVCDVHYSADVDASSAVDRDIETAEFEVKHTKDNVISVLQNVNILNSAIAHLGDLQTADELASGTTNHLNGQGFSAAFARTGRRLWQWTTGKDAKTMEERWEKKCLSHHRANAAFQHQTRNYEFSSAVELARYVAAFHWKQLPHLLEANFVGMELPKEDDKKPMTTSPKKTNWVNITGAKVLQVKGGGTQLLWDSRRIWLPTSQLKKVDGYLQIPAWLAQKNDMI